MARPRKPVPRRKSLHPGIYDRGDYWQVRVRYTDKETGAREELENRREDFNRNDPESKEAALQRAIMYLAAERAMLITHGTPMSETPESQTLGQWLMRYRDEVLLPHKDGLIPLPGQKVTAAVSAKIPPYSRGMKYKKGWKKELEWVDRWLGIGVAEKARFLSSERRAQVVPDQAFFRKFFARDVLSLKAGDFHGKPDSLTTRSRGQKGGDGVEGTKLRHLAVISAVYARAQMAWGFDAIPNPIKAMVGKPTAGARRERPLADDEWETVLVELQNLHPTTQAFIRFTRWSAVRRGEASKLRWEHVKGWGTPDVVARLVDTKTPKLGEVNGRTIPLHPEAVAAIASILDDPDKPPRTGWVFPSPKDPQKPLPGGTAYQAWDRARARAGLPPNERGEIPTIHDLRHTRLSELVNAGLELPKMMVVSGHKDTRTAMRYYHGKPAEIGVEILALEQKRKKRDTKANPLTLDDEALKAAIKQDPKLARRLLAVVVAAQEDDD